MDIILTMHIIAGIIALFAAAMSVFSKKGKKTHITFGRIYFFAMLVIFLTAITMSIVKGNITLFLIAIFSFYLAFSGIRFARNKKGKAQLIDWLAVSFMGASSLGMLILSFKFFKDGNSQFITLLVFSYVAGVIGYTDFVNHKNNLAIGKKRIARHLSNMLGGTIAVITAILVVNIDIEPLWIWWILPTILITPIIIWWNIKILK